MLKFIAPVLLVISLGAATVPSQAPTAPAFSETMPNGQFWSQLTHGEKRAWVYGYSDGIKTAAAFTNSAEPTNKLLTAYVLNLQPTEKLSVGEIVQGVDHFYQDAPENAPVVMGAAIRFVGLKASGATQPELDDFVGGVRKASATPLKQP